MPTGPPPPLHRSNFPAWLVNPPRYQKVSWQQLHQRRAALTASDASVRVVVSAARLNSRNPAVVRLHLRRPQGEVEAVCAQRSCCRHYWSQQRSATLQTAVLKERVALLNRAFTGAAAASARTRRVQAGLTVSQSSPTKKI